MYKKIGRLPANSRITINYEGEKPSVKFEYPRKNAIEQVSRGGITFLLAFIICLIVFSVVASYFDNWYSNNEIKPINCELTRIEGNITNQLYYINVACQGINETFWVNPGTKRLLGIGRELQLSPSINTRPLWKRFSSPEEAGSIIFYFVCLVGAVILSRQLAKIIVKYPNLSGMYPKFQRKTSGRGYYASWKEVPESKVLEVPFFANIWLDYKATQEFSDNLIRVEIHEHPFSKIVRKGKRKRKVKDIYHWYCKFYFKDIPKTGKLEVWFR